MKKVLIYPFTEEMAPFVKQENLLKDIDITSIVSLKGNGILGDKYKFNGKSLEVSENFDKELEKCTYILLNNFYSDESENIILENIKKAVNHGKKII
ncbi:TIGR04066 family peptide maturation system protein, partial [Clostridioides difficile]|nr:TIGR04066 family peptide maturation system protein [Clostridioides difficile]